MKDELLPVLRQSYPELFASPHLLEIGCYPGWLDLLDDLCKQLQTYLDANPGTPPIIVRQVKEKFGGLRFYISGGDECCQAIVDAAEESSLTLCEVCGRPGTLVGERWVYVRCPQQLEWMPHPLQPY